jgi:sterol desaturase/sphingolipid hydroxylase (fatty acid hydroxylase superfamily)
VRNLVRYGFVPFMFLGLNGAAFAIVYHGYSYAWLALLLAVAIGLVFAAERIAPAYGMWNEDHGDKAATLAHAIVYEISNINGVLLIPVIVWLFPVQGIWPTHWPLIVQLVMAVVFADFAFTMVHYFSHRIPVLWRLHAVHHGVPRLYGFNGLVRHPLHQTLDMVVGTAPLVVMGLPVDVAVLLGFVISIQLLVQHANIGYELGPLRNHLSIGQLHHLHHVNWGKEGDCNFGLFLIVWDRMLGTFQEAPSRPIQAHDMGIDEVPKFPKRYIEQLIFPFVYHPGAGVQSGLLPSQDAMPAAKAATNPTNTRVAPHGGQGSRAGEPRGVTPAE